MTEFAEQLEREAVALYRAFGLDPEHGHQSLEIISKLGMELMLTDTPMPGGARLGVGKRIWVQRGIRPKRAFFDVSHELAAWLLRGWGYTAADTEERENRLGACLLLPRPTIINALRSSQWRGVRSFAHTLQVSETCASLRLGEATGDGVAVIGRDSVRIRGEWTWEDEPERLAHCRRLPPGMFRARIEKERTVLGQG